MYTSSTSNTVAVVHQTKEMSLKTMMIMEVKLIKIISHLTPSKEFLWHQVIRMEFLCVRNDEHLEHWVCTICINIYNCQWDKVIHSFLPISTFQCKLIWQYESQKTDVTPTKQLFFLISTFIQILKTRHKTAVTVNINISSFYTQLSQTCTN